MRDEKRCPACKDTKPRVEYTKCSSHSDGLDTYCKACMKIRYQEYLTRPGVKENYRKHNRKHAARRTAENKLKIKDILTATPCKDCGCSDPRVLEFDHVNGKTRSVSTMLNFCWESVLKEIEKCEVVCANCHRIRTYDRSGSHRSTWVRRD